MTRSKAETKREQEKEIFQFTSLRVWREIFPVVLDIEKALKEKQDNFLIGKVLSRANQSLEYLVTGYYKFHLPEKYLSYNRAREEASISLFLIYRLGFMGIVEKEKVLEFGKRFRESIKMINSLIKNLENKIKRLDEAKFILEKIRGS